MCLFVVTICTPWASGTTYITQSDSGVACLKRRTGKVLWRRHDTFRDPRLWIEDGRLIVEEQSPPRGRIKFGFRKLGTREARQHLLELPGYYRPLVTVRDDVVVLFDGTNPALDPGLPALLQDLGEPAAKEDFDHGTYKIQRAGNGSIRNAVSRCSFKPRPPMATTYALKIRGSTAASKPRLSNAIPACTSNARTWTIGRSG